MRADLVVIARVRSQNPTQMSLAQDDDMVDALATDRSDQPFSVSILPRRIGRDRLVAYPHGAQTTPDDSAKDAIPITDEIAWSFVPGERFGYLTRNTLRGWMFGY